MPEVLGCGCDPHGSISSQCDAAGQCQCKVSQRPAFCVVQLSPPPGLKRSPVVPEGILGPGHGMGEVGLLMTAGK